MHEGVWAFRVCVLTRGGLHLEDTTFAIGTCGVYLCERTIDDRPLSCRGIRFLSRAYTAATCTARLNNITCFLSMVNMCQGWRMSGGSVLQRAFYVALSRVRVRAEHQ